MIRIFVGFDQREAAVYHAFCQSVIEHATVPVQFIPLAENLLHFDGQQDGTNQFIYSRYLIPVICGFEGEALFFDGDMVVNRCPTDLLQSIDHSKAVSVVKHDYTTAHKRKYVGTPIENSNVDYPRKNWSSVMHWRCDHPRNKILTRGFVASAGGVVLHRFGWLDDEEIGELPLDWNWLVGEYPENSSAACLHYTLGAPGFAYYRNCAHATRWHETLIRANNMAGEQPDKMVRRSWQSLRTIRP